MRGRCERAAVSSRVSIVWGAALNRILRMRRDNIVNDNQSLPEKSGLKLRSLSASNGSRALTKVRRAAFNANEQHSPTPTPSAGAADPPHRGEGMGAKHLNYRQKRLPLPLPLVGLPDSHIP